MLRSLLRKALIAAGVVGGSGVAFLLIVDNLIMPSIVDVPRATVPDSMASMGMICSCTIMLTPLLVSRTRQVGTSFPLGCIVAEPEHATRRSRMRVDVDGTSRARVRKTLRCIFPSNLVAHVRVDIHVDLDDATALDAGGQLACAVSGDDGAVYCWGKTYENDVLATNGYAGQLAPWLADRVDPTRGQVLSTSPLSQRLFEQPIYASHGYEYWQQLDSGEVVMGGWRNLDMEGEVGRAVLSTLTAIAKHNDGSSDTTIRVGLKELTEVNYDCIIVTDG